MPHQDQTVPSVQDLFAAALDLPPERRSAFLQAACADAPATLALVQAFLDEHERAGSFLASSPLAPPSGTEPTIDDTPGPSSGAPTFAPPRFRPLQLIAGRFLVVRFLARGGMGEVYEVRDQFLQGSGVALKIIRPEIAADAASSQRFEQEVLLARKVTHPNLCPIYDISRCEQPAPPFLFLTMKLLRGETLDARLRSPQALSSSQATDICTQLIRGVGAMHAAGVIHRDLKPNNVMLEPSTGKDPNRLCVSIMDFGLARLHEAEMTVARSGLAGTPGYLAPELLRGQRPTQATDLFALGIVLHMVLTGERPLDQQKALGVTPAPSLRSSAAPPHLLQAVEDLLANDPGQRCRAFDSLYAALESHHPAPVRSTPRLTRRRFLVTAGASACALAGTAAFRREQIYDWMHPLPQKRFVAVLNWPPTKDPKIRPMLSGLLDSIANELARAEAYDRNFFVTTQRQTTALNTPKDLVEASESLGTNLVLAASATTIGHDLRIILKVLDPTTPRTLRVKDLQTSLSQIFSLPQRAVHLAAELLDVNHYNPNDTRNGPGTNNPDALAAFQAAELMRKQDNDTGLEQSIEEYKEALELDPHFAKAQAQLAWAYLRLYGIDEQAPALALARENSEGAIDLDPNLAPAHTALAWVLEQAGDHDQAQKQVMKALALDPSNPHTLNYQARIYEGQGQYEKAAQTYARIVKLRPNFWLGHEEFGALLQDQGKYPEALNEYRLAALAAPRNALARGNIGSVYLDMGNLDEAVPSLQISLDLEPTAEVASRLAAAYRARQAAADAIKFARQATTIDPASADSWLELGDSLSAAGKFQADALAAYRHAAQAEEEDLHTEPKSGPRWMLLALCRVKRGTPDGALALLSKAESFHAEDMSSQLIKVRTLELLGRRDDALAAIAHCLTRGATVFQFDTMPDLNNLQADPRYKQLIAFRQSNLWRRNEQA